MSQQHRSPDPKEKHFKKKVLDGDKGKLMLQISKTFKGDSRFKLDHRFQKDVDIEQMPERFKQTLQNDLLQKVKQKTKHIKKEQPPLIIRRFQPGTKEAETIVKKAEGKKQYIQNIIKSQKKKLKKNHIQKGIDKVKKADQLLHRSKQPRTKAEFKIEVKRDRKETFQPTHFKLFE